MWAVKHKSNRQKKGYPSSTPSSTKLDRLDEEILPKHNQSSSFSRAFSQSENNSNQEISLGYSGQLCTAHKHRNVSYTHGF